MKYKIFSMMLSFTIIFVIMSSTAYADIGPKPSVVIDFIGLENQNYYVTLLSEIPSTGPHSVLSETAENQRYTKDDEEYEIWQKFVSYEDKDGYYFLQYFNDCTDTSQFTWGYWPPPKFKILIYFPEQDSFSISTDAYERYAFDSYYKVEVTGSKIQSVLLGDSIEAEKDYDYKWEMISLFARIIVTIAIEVLIALFYGFRAKKQLLLIVAVNIVTQTILNILLNVVNYNQGSMMFVFNYIWMEALVTIIEAGVYCVFLQKFSRTKLTKKSLAPLYALTANVVSFGIGLFISYLIPGVF